MKGDKNKSTDSIRESTQRAKPNAPEAGESEDECRCKEVSKKSLPELIKLMFRDLAFWKKRGAG